jgi:uncharacterized protein (DUF1697 family)
MVNNTLTTYIALIRGINVSGKNLIKMDSLKNNLLQTGLESVQTYIQSGNLVFHSYNSDSSELGNMIHKMIQGKYGINAPVLVKSASYWYKAILENPFLQRNDIQAEFLHLTLLDKIPETFHLATISTISHAQDSGIIIEDRVYLFCPGGYGNTKLSNSFFEKKLKLKATTRNWKTVLKLSEMANATAS